MKTARAASPWTRHYGPAIALLWLLAALAFAAIGVSVGLSPVYNVFRATKLAASYRIVMAQPVRLDVPVKAGDGGIGGYAARYEFDGKAYLTTRFTLLEDTSLEERANRIVAKNLKNAIFTQSQMAIFVDPTDPAFAVVDRDFPIRSSLIDHVIFGLVFVLIALGALVCAVDALVRYDVYRRVALARMWALSAIVCVIGFSLPLMMSDDAKAGDVGRNSIVYTLVIGIEIVGAMFLVGFLVSLVSVFTARKARKQA